MSDVSNVYSFGSRIPDTDQRSEFLNHLAAAYDNYVEAVGCEPDAVVAVWCGIKQPARSTWLVTRESEGGATSCLALATQVMSKACSDNGEE